jgi:Glycosyltransferase
MKIVYTIAGLFRPAGMERVLTEKATRLAESGHEITIVTTEQKGRPVVFPLPETVKTVDLNIGYEDDNGRLLSKLLRHPWRQLRHRLRLGRLLRAIKPDVTISLFCNDERFLPSLRDGSKKVLEVHFSAFKRLQYGRNGLWGLLDKVRAKGDLRAVRRFDKFIVLTEEDKGYWGNPENAVVIPNPLPFEVTEPAALESKRLAAVGRLCYQKSFDRLLEAWKIVSPQVPGWTLSIFGDGEERESLERLAEGLPVKFEGNVTDAEKIYRDTSLIVLTSRYEGLPMVLIEAQAYGIPAVSFDCKCGPSDVIADGVNGILVKEGDVEGFAAAMLSLLNNPDKLHEMGRAAFAGASKWSPEKIISQWMHLLENL